MTEINFLEIGGWATIEIKNDVSSYSFDASDVRSSSFNELLEALTIIATSQTTNATAIFDLEMHGNLNMIFTHLPYSQVAGFWNTYLRLEVYEGVYWDQYDDLIDDFPVPQPVFQCIIPDEFYFINSIIKEYERWGKEAFEYWDNENWDEQIQKLKEAVKKIRR